MWKKFNAFKVMYTSVTCTLFPRLGNILKVKIIDKDFQRIRNQKCWFDVNGEVLFVKRQVST